MNKSGSVILLILCFAVCFFAGISPVSAQTSIDQQLQKHTTERSTDRDKMVRHLEDYYGIGNEGVLAAMRSVPRHRFVPMHEQPSAYADHALPIGLGQTISQPFIVAYMTEMLELKPGAKVLEIGTGSGYQAAVLAEITPHVYTIEIINPLGEAAAERLGSLGYTSVKAMIGDGYYGWEEHAPFDAIIVTAAAGHIPPPLVEQLKAGGKIVIPVGPPGWTQILILVSKEDDETIRTKQLIPVRFVPMTGEVQRETP